MGAKTGGKKKKAGKVLLIILAVILLLAGFLTFHAVRNTKTMNNLIREGLHSVEMRYDVTPLDAGEYKDMRFYGLMKFHVDQYRVEELGNLSVMTANMGMMQMVSFMITPFEKNVPLCTLDFMYIMGNRKSYVEFYDLVGDTATPEYQQVLESLRTGVQFYSDIEEIPAEEHWYDSYLSVVMHKKLKGSDEDRNRELFLNMLEIYLESSKTLEKSAPEDAERQFEITQNYSDGLIEKGGVSTDVFKKALGEEKTRDFFNRVFFGTDNYRTEKQ